MSHLIKIYTVCKFSYFRLEYLKNLVGAPVAKGLKNCPAKLAVWDRFLLEGGAFQPQMEFHCTLPDLAEKLFIRM